MIDIKGKVRWLERTFTLVYCGGKNQKLLRHVMLWDLTLSFKISVWVELIDEVEEGIYLLMW